MDLPSCPGCRQRDAVLGRLQTRLEQTEARLTQREQTIRRLQATVDRLTERLAQYEPAVRQETTGGGSPTPAPADDYSLEAEHRRRHRRRRRQHRKPSPGRRPTALKFAEAERFEAVYPPACHPNDCQLVRERAVWRLENGRAVRVGYRVFAVPGGREPPIPGVTPRCEYGLEILVVLAYLVYIIGLSLAKAGAVLAFFCQLPLTKAQADALLRQLGQHWEAEYDTLCELIAHAAVVGMDETGWQVGGVGCSLWAFASQCQRVFVFGCAKDEATLDQLLPPDVFTGIGVSDDAAVYRDRFVQGQKCWAHLLRKAIKLALLYPRTKKYQRFLDQLLELYHTAKRAAADGRLGPDGRKHRVAELEGQLCRLCARYERASTAGLAPPERDFTNLANELLRLLRAEELFTFVLVPDVEPTNNSLERLLRNPALDRKAGRTNQTAAGAHRRSVIVSVLESLRANLAQFTLASVLAEVGRWLQDGMSLFAQQWQELLEQPAAAVPDTS